MSPCNSKRTWPCSAFLCSWLGGADSTALSYEGVKQEGLDLHSKDAVAEEGVGEDQRHIVSGNLQFVVVVCLSCYEVADLSYLPDEEHSEHNPVVTVCPSLVDAAVHYDHGSGCEQEHAEHHQESVAHAQVVCVFVAQRAVDFLSIVTLKAQKLVISGWA